MKNESFDVTLCCAHTNKTLQLTANPLRACPPLSLGVEPVEKVKVRNGIRRTIAAFDL
jgi:hypothetical protein